MALLCFWAADLAAASDEDRWFIVLGSYDRKDLALAQDQAERLAGRGLTVTLADTDDFPNLKDGLWAVALGPFNTTEAAEKMVRRARGLVPDAYIKSGW